VWRPLKIGVKIGFQARSYPSISRRVFPKKGSSIILENCTYQAHFGLSNGPLFSSHQISWKLETLKVYKICNTLQKTSWTFLWNFQHSDSLLFSSTYRSSNSPFKKASRSVRDGFHVMFNGILVTESLIKKGWKSPVNKSGISNSGAVWKQKAFKSKVIARRYKA